MSPGRLVLPCRDAIHRVSKPVRSVSRGRQPRAAHTPRNGEHPVRPLAQLTPYYRQYTLLRYEKFPLRQHLQRVVKTQPLHFRPVIIPPAQRLVPQPYQLLVSSFTHNTMKKNILQTQRYKKPPDILTSSGFFFLTALPCRDAIHRV